MSRPLSDDLLNYASGDIIASAAYVTISSEKDFSRFPWTSWRSILHVMSLCTSRMAANLIIRAHFLPARICLYSFSIRFSTRWMAFNALNVYEQWRRRIFPSHSRQAIRRRRDLRYAKFAHSLWPERRTKPEWHPPKCSKKLRLRQHARFSTGSLLIKSRNCA